jgi:hypothetical protein
LPSTIVSGFKVRFLEQSFKPYLSALTIHPLFSERTVFESYPINSIHYFSAILQTDLFPGLTNALRLDVFEGVVSSADAGSEEIIRSSRTALVDLAQVYAALQSRSVLN